MVTATVYVTTEWDLSWGSAAGRPVLWAYMGVIVLGRARYEGMFRSHFTEHDELKVQKKVCIIL